MSSQRPFDSPPAADPAFGWREYALLAAAAVFFYAFLFQFPLTPFFGDGDQSIFLYDAQRIVSGDVMYRDFFQFTFPGTQAFYAAMFLIFGQKFWIVGASVFAIGMATAALMLKLSKGLLPDTLHLLPAALFVFFGFRWVGFDGSHRMFSPVFILVALLIAFRYANKRAMLAAGVMLGIAAGFTQQRGLVALAAICLFLVLDTWRSGTGFGHGTARIAVLAAGFAAALLAICLPFALSSGIGAFVEATLVYPYKYYGYGHPNNWRVYFTDLAAAFRITRPGDIVAIAPTIFHCVVVPLAVLLAGVTFLVKQRSRPWTESRGIALITGAAILLTLTTTAPNFFRLFQIASICLIAVIWLFAQYLSAPTAKKLASIVTLALVALGLFQASRVQTNWQAEKLETPVGTLAMLDARQAERYKWLAANTRPGDYFFEVYEPFVYFPLGLKNPTPYGQIWPSDYTRPEHVAETARGIAEKRPRFILWDNSYFVAHGTRQPGDHTGPLAELVRERYAPIGEVYDIGGKPVQIWKIKEKN